MRDMLVAGIAHGAIAEVERSGVPLLDPSMASLANIVMRTGITLSLGDVEYGGDPESAQHPTRRCGRVVEPRLNGVDQRDGSRTGHADRHGRTGWPEVG